MEKDDKEMMVGLLSKQVGKAVSEWSKKNDVHGPIYVRANKTNPSCYLDEHGVVHYGDLVTVDVDLLGDDNDDNDY